MYSYYSKQPSPVLKNQFLSDDVLLKYLPKFIPKEIYNEINPDLISFGKRVAEDLLKLAQDVERYKPILEKFDAWGNELNVIHTSLAWNELKSISCIERLVSIPYTNKEHSRLYQFVKLYLFAPSSGLYSCPLSMTDGAVYLINLIKKQNPELITRNMIEAYNSMLSNNPKHFWTSGQWMTEIKGGSDVRNSTETIAIKNEDGSYSLFGLKWFTSAIDADLSFTLAKIKNEEKIDDAPTLFFVKVRDSKDGRLNNINPIRLKDKMGTRQLPTAELILEGTKAEIASPPKKGLSYIMNLANITRLHNITSSVAYMRRMIALLEDYSNKRVVFGKRLSEQPLHIVSFSQMKMTFEGNLLLSLQLFKMQGKIETGENYKNKDLLRILLPIAKLFVARCSEEVCLEGMQGFGGVGYMENSNIPGILRDTIVTSIWEGSINLLAYDFNKVVLSSKESFVKLMTKIEKNLNRMDKPIYEQLMSNLKEFKSSDYFHDKKNSRSIAFWLCSLYIISLISKYDKENLLLIKFWLAKERTYYSQLKLTQVIDLPLLQQYSFSTPKAKF